MPTSRPQPGRGGTKPNAITTVVSVAVASRIATIALMVLANAVLPTHDAGGVHKFRPRTFPVPAGPAGIDGRDGGVLSAFTRWDAAWFLSIADSGYPSPSLSGGLGEEVDCGGTPRAWGGEEYEHDQLRREPDDERTKQEGDGEGEGISKRHGEVPLASPADRKLRCRSDVPLEEQAHAFFPLYPWLVRWAAAAIRALLLPVGFTLGKGSSLVVAAVFVSNTCFVGAAVLLHRLGAIVTGDSLLAYRGALAFCVTPASIFFSTAYTESLYAALTFGGLLVLFSEGERRRRRRSGGERTRASSGSGGDTSAMTQTAKGSRALRASGGGVARSSSRGTSSSWWSGAVSSWAAAALLSLATLTRSNGIAGAGVLVLEKLRWMASDAGLFTHADSRDGSAATHVGQAAPPAATGSSPAATRPQSKKTNSRDGSDGDGVGVGEHDGGAFASAAAAPAAASSGGACSRWDGSVLCLRLATSLLATALQALLVVAPYLLVQAYAYRKFCVGGEAATAGGDHGSYEEEEEEGGIGSGYATTAEGLRLYVQQLHPWCAWRVPSVYAHVQSAYWNVGALRYYQWKQIPNFLLAAPAMALTAWGAVRFFSAQLRLPPEPVAMATRVGEGRSGGIDPARWRRSAAVRLLFPTWLEQAMGVFFGRPKLPRPSSSPFERTGAAALIAQWAFFAVFAALCMNVQVTTRFLAAACPPLHWWTAFLLARADDGDVGSRAGGGRERAVTAAAEGSDGAVAVRTCLRWYLVVYFVLGAVLHANFLPWT